MRQPGGLCLVVNSFISKRKLVGACVLAALLALPAVAAAAAWRRSAPSVRIVARGSVSGAVTAIGDSSFTVQTPGRAVGVVNALIAAANRVTGRAYPYVYGGGHAQAGIASVGIKGPGYTGHTLGYDCSGSVAAVLAAGGLWPGGSDVPNDAGIVSQLLAEGLIARGAASGPVGVTLYDNPGVHIFMNIDGRFFGTSDGGGGGNRHGGAGWLDDGAPDAFSPTYKRYHLLPSVLRNSTNAGHSVTFQLPQDPSVIGAMQLGDKVEVSYAQTSSGTIVANSLSYRGAITATGTVQSIAAGGFTIQTSSGTTVTLTTIGSADLQSLAVGDTVQVLYTKSPSGAVARTIQVTASAPATTNSATGSGYNGGYSDGHNGGYGDGGWQ
jgi:hypothetical protein